MTDSSEGANPHPLSVAASYVVFGPFILTDPCDPWGNCISAKQFLGALTGTGVWVGTILGIWRLVT